MPAVLIRSSILLPALHSDRVNPAKQRRNKEKYKKPGVSSTAGVFKVGATLNCNLKELAWLRKNPRN
jgi:hypothetical protein